MLSFPTHAIIAVTLNCNSRCVMCDIWKNKSHHELTPPDFLRLPSSLKDINITGGEPFLRPDLPEIIKNIKIAAPHARLVLNTNGFLPLVIKKQIPAILQIDPRFAVRLSLDGWQGTHQSLRRIPQAFHLVQESLTLLKKAGVKDLGLSFTIMEANYRELPAIYEFSRQQHLDLSLTLATDSPIYFGSQKQTLRPRDHQQITAIITQISRSRLRTLNFKNWYRAWFETKLAEYAQSNRRPIPCLAGQKLFYLDPQGNVYPCQLQSKPLGNLTKLPFAEIWNSHSSDFRRCHSCWMICSVKPSSYTYAPLIISQIITNKLQSPWSKKS